ncbi:MAG: hypothetical protein AMK72_09945 [Planctomycetes bacterium SM23_25]|nr:MAG: hypothetical protein AMK72_09945 [Planctomycetes bacterium SM23_25]
MLDDRRRALAAKPADAGEPVRLRLWRAHVLARMPDGLDKGIDEYQAVAEDSAYPRCARVFARMNQVFLLHKAGRCKEMLDLVDRVVREFPQVRPDKGHSLKWYINDAKRNLKKASDARDSKVQP